MKKVVSATLAGALAVGMVPAVALADEAADQQLELQTQDAVAAFNNATVNAIWSDGVTDYVPATATTHSKNWTGSAQYVEIEGLNIVGPVTVDLDASDLTAANGYDVYYTDANGAKVLAADIKASGTYSLVIEAGEKSPYDGGKIVIPFTIAGKTFAGLGYRDTNPDGTFNISDTVFNYDGAAQNVAFIQNIGGVWTALKEGTDYTVKYFKAGVDRYNAANVLSAVVDAGDYVAELTGIGDYAGAKTDVAFTVESFDLSAANIVIDDVVGATTALPTAVTSIAGTTAMNNLVTVATAPVSISALQGGLGAYTATVSAVDTNKNGLIDDAFVDNATPYQNVYGTNNTITFNKVAALATFEYDGAAMPSTWTTDLSVKKPVHFNLNDIEVLKADGTDLAAAAWGIEVFPVNADGTLGASLGANLPQTAGVYKVVAKVDAPNVENYLYGGSASTVVTVTNGAYDGDETLYAYYDNKVVNSVELTYGETFTGVSGVLKTSANAGELDCTVTYYDANGKVIAANKVDDAAGTYKAVLTVAGYELENNEIEIVVKPFVVNGYAHENTTIDNHGKKIVEWTDANITAKPRVWIDADADGKVDTTPVNEIAQASAKMPAGVSYSWVMVFNGEKSYDLKMKDKGTYEFYIQLNNAADAANVVLPAEPLKITVGVPTAFADVPADYWAIEEIEKAVAASYVNGHSGTDLFTPDKSIKRADLICIAYNIATATNIVEGDWGQVDETQGFDVESYFSDVDNGAYYAKALYWAASAGIANGDKGKDTFRPMDTITREEAGAILYNLAEVAGYDMAAENVLASYPDGSKVSGWAKDVMSWMASNGYMGQGGYLMPGKDITRAEATVIAVRIFPTESFSAGI